MKITKRLKRIEMFSIISRSFNIMKAINVRGVRLESSSSNKIFPDENWFVKNRFLAARGWILTKMAELDRFCEQVNSMKPPETRKVGFEKITDMNLVRYNSLKAVASTRAGMNSFKRLDIYKSVRERFILNLNKTGNAITTFLEKKFK